MFLLCPIKYSNNDGKLLIRVIMIVNLDVQRKCTMRERKIGILLGRHYLPQSLNVPCAFTCVRASSLIYRCMLRQLFNFLHFKRKKILKNHLLCWHYARCFGTPIKPKIMSA